MSRNQLAQRSDGRFKVNYKNKQFYGKSKKEALRKRDEYVALERAGIDYDCCDTPFTEYGLRWLETYRVDCSSPSTAAVCRNDPICRRKAEG